MLSSVYLLRSARKTVASMHGSSAQCMRWLQIVLSAGTPWCREEGLASAMGAILDLG